MQYNCTRITLAFYMYKIVIVNGPLLQRYETKKKSVCWMIHEVPPPQVGQWTLCPQTHNAVERHINFWTREFQGEQWNFKSWCIHFVIAYYNSKCLFSQLFGWVTIIWFIWHYSVIHRFYHTNDGEKIFSLHSYAQ